MLRFGVEYFIFRSMVEYFRPSFRFRVEYRFLSFRFRVEHFMIYSFRLSAWFECFMVESSHCVDG